MNKRGIVDDMVVWLGLLVTAGLAIVVVFLIFDGMNTGIQASPLGTKEKTFFSDFTTDYRIVWDYTFLTVFVASLVALLILSFFLQANPAMFFAVWFIVILLGIVSAGLSNGIETAFNDNVLSAASTQFPITSYILEHLVLFTMMSAFLMLLVFFGKPGGEGG